MTGFELRKEQQAVIDGYRGGYAAISAVPGAGKTTTLSALAAHLIEGLEPRQRVMIVTYQNSGVANFRRAVVERLQERGQIERGFVVCTLHSLANEVLSSVRHRAGVDHVARLIDDAEASRLRDDAVRCVIERHWESLAALVIDPNARGAKNWPDEWLLGKIVKEAVTKTTLLGIPLSEIRERCLSNSGWLPFVLDACLEYQTALRERGFMDYDGLIRRAVDTLEQNPLLCQRLRRRWPYILEDEAQDSNPQLERMLRLIAGIDGNLVRVGDPNQAIMTTFTSSSVDGFREWLSDTNVQRFNLVGSSRSTKVILKLANSFVERVVTTFEIEDVRSTALQVQPIVPIRANGILANPAVPWEEGQGLDARVFEHSDQERKAVLCSAINHLSQHPDETVAILVGARDVGYEYAEMAKGMGFPDKDIVRLLGSKDGRPVGLIGKLLPIIRYLERPTSGALLGNALHAWSELGDEDRVVRAVRQLHLTSDPPLDAVLFPQRSHTISDVLRLPYDLNQAEELSVQRLSSVPNWLENRNSAPDELLSLIPATIQPDDAERTLLHAIVATIQRAPPDPKRSRLEFLNTILTDLQKQHRQLRGSLDEHEINIAPGTLTISTRHQAKGLEWDTVFAIGCDEFWFHGTLDFKPFDQKEFLGPIDPVLAMTTELRFALSGCSESPSMSDFEEATAKQAVKVVAEGLRVMYVTLTRARSRLSLSWHRVGKPYGGRKERDESPVFPLLCALVEEVRMEAVSVAAD